MLLRTLWSDAITAARRGLLSGALVVVILLFITAARASLSFN